MIKDIGEICTNHKHKYYKKWQLVVNLFLITSCIALALATVPSIWAIYEAPFNILEFLTVALFTFDYVANLFFSEKKFKYALSIWGIIDLISILPTYLTLLNLPALQATKMLRLLRVARIIREFKLDADQQENSNPLILNLKIYLIIFFSVMMISSASMYAVEGTLYSPEKMKIEQTLLNSQVKLSEDPKVFMPFDPISGDPIPEDKRFFTSILQCGGVS